MRRDDVPDGASAPAAPARRGRSLAAALATIVLLVAALPRTTRADDVANLVAEADALRVKGEAPRAIALLRPLADDPATAADARVQSAFGKALLAGGDPADAAAAFRAVVRLRPDVADRLDLASSLLTTATRRIADGARLSRDVVPYLDEAISVARAAKPADPETARRFACVVGEAELLRSNPEAARAAVSDPSIAKDLVTDDLLARACYALGHFAQAAEAWGRAGNAEAEAAAWSAAKDPRAIPWYAARALEHWNDAGVGDMAIRGAAYVDGGDGLDAALRAGIGGADVPEAKRTAVERLRGRLAERRGRYRDAVDRYRAVQAARPADWASNRDLARALFALSTDDAVMRDEAVERYLKVLGERPDDVDTRTGLGWQARLDATNAHREWPDHRRLDRAVEIFRTLAETAPDDGLGWAQYGNAARIAGASVASLEAFERAVAVNEFDASTWNDRGIALLAAGRTKEAVASFEQAIRIDPGDTSSRQNAARQLRLSGSDDAADVHLAAALRTARAVGGQASLYRALIDRGLRARRRPELR